MLEQGSKYACGPMWQNGGRPNGQPISFLRLIYMKQVRESGLQLVTELEGIDVQSCGEGDIEKPKAQRLEMQWNIAAPLWLSFRIFSILGNQGCLDNKTQELGGYGEGRLGYYWWYILVGEMRLYRLSLCWFLSGSLVRKNWVPP